MSRKLILVERLADGRYRASRGSAWLEWDPLREPVTGIVKTSTATRAFLSALRDLDLGVGCAICGYLEYAHNIDGEERAPCSGFAAPPQGDETP